MTQRSWSTSYEYYASLAELPEMYREVLAAAHKGVEMTHSPYSNFRVGAGLLLANGSIVNGGNQENAAFPNCLCAERVVLAGAACAHPRVVVQVMAITARSPIKTLDQPVFPCGSCRQSIAEIEAKQNAPIILVLQGAEGPIAVFSGIADLLPFGFDSTFFSDEAI